MPFIIGGLRRCNHLSKPANLSLRRSMTTLAWISPLPANEPENWALALSRNIVFSLRIGLLVHDLARRCIYTSPHDYRLDTWTPRHALMGRAAVIHETYLDRQTSRTTTNLVQTRNDHCSRARSSSKLTQSKSCFRQR